jgi:DNA topoisomerase-1
MRVLGQHPDTGEEITVRRGPYGLYVQQGEASEDKKVRPKRTSLPRGMDGEQLTLDQAMGLLSLPREVGLHPETHDRIEVGIGRFGPYVRMGAVFGSLDKDDDVLAIGINRAVDLLAKKLASVRTIGPHPADQDLVTVRKGRFGPYIQHGKTVANLPRGVAMEDVTLNEAVALLTEKGKALKPRGAVRKKARTSGRAASPAKAAEKAPRKAPAKKKAASPSRKAAPKARLKVPRRAAE